MSVASSRPWAAAWTWSLWLCWPSRTRSRQSPRLRRWLRVGSTQPIQLLFVSCSPLLGFVGGRAGLRYAKRIENVGVLRGPGKPDPAAFVLPGFSRGFHILAHRHQLFAAVEPDQVPR